MAMPGLDKVMKNLNKELNTIENKTVASLVKAAILIQRDMESSPPLTPVDLGNLRSSYFITAIKQTVASSTFVGPNAEKIKAFSDKVVSTCHSKTRKNNGKYSVYFGFSAYYAARVHEMSFANFKRPGSGAFFFEASVKRNSSTIIDLVKREAAIR